MSFGNVAARWRLLFLVSFFVAACTGCERTSASSDSASQLPVASVVLPQRSTLSNRLEVAGELLPYQEVELHAKVSGYIRKINVDIGDRVRKGQVLAELDIPELAAQVEEAQSGVLRSQEDIKRAGSAVARAEADHRAVHEAYSRLKQASDAQAGLIAQQELDDAQAKDSSSEAQIEVAKADLSAMEQALAAAKANHLHYSSLADYARIVAPYAGVVTWRYSDTGSLVQAGTSSAGAQPIVKLAETDILRLRIPVPETLASYVSVGETARIHIPSTGADLTGKVVRTTGELDLSTRTLQVEIDLKNGDRKLQPGMYADVSLDVQGTGSVLTLPVQAVDRSGGRPSALVVDNNGRIERRELVLGLENPNRVEITSGLTDRDRVVAANLASFTPGESVRAQTIELPQFKPNGGSGAE
jgi:RND family efflux transporter MFP subunit